MDEHTGQPEGTEPLRPRLAVWATVGQAYAIWFANLGLWLKLSIVPVVLLIGLNAVAPSVLPDAKDVSAGSVGFAAGFFFFFAIIVYLAEIPLATAWHRYILTHEDTASHRYLIGNREWRYLLKALLIALIVLLFSLIVGLVIALVMVPFVMAMVAGPPTASLPLIGLVTSLVTLGFYALIGRYLGHLFLMLPAAAIGSNLSRKDTKAAVKSNEWRLVGVYALSVVPIWIIGVALTFPVDGVAILTSRDLLGHVPALVFAPVIVGVLSITYRELVQKPEAASGNTGQSPATLE